MNSARKIYKSGKNKLRIRSNLLTKKYINVLKCFIQKNPI